MTPSSSAVGTTGLTAAAYLGRAGLSTLVLERREIVGGCCVTEEIAPGCRVSTTSYVASMLRPEVIRDLKLAEHGLRMVPCDPSIQVPFPMVASFRGGPIVIALWPNFASILQKMLKRLYGSMTSLRSWLAICSRFFSSRPGGGQSKRSGWTDLVRVGKRFRKISSAEIAELVSFLTGSLGEFLDRNYESDTIKTMFLANNVYGKHGGPYQPGTAIGLLFHLLSGGAHDVQGFYGHVMGGMGSITQDHCRGRTKAWCGDSNFCIRCPC
jgi:phytoene dehydrogenase-like protein